jgi:transposase
MKERRKFSSEQKAQIVLAVLKKEATILELSNRYQITPSLVHKWRDAFLEKVNSIFDDGKEESDKDRKIKQYEHVISKITTQNDFLEKVLAVTK